ncbi:hypothetical protein LB505_010639 [Fusarium chuoi]|nr:hypothetical protein LB505_010639 [Fusarium chuoi]
MTIATCLPLTTNNVPLLPFTRPGFKAQQTAKPRPPMQPANLGQASQTSVSANILAANAPPAVQTPVDNKGIYWCIERSLTEPTEI